MECAGVAAGGTITAAGVFTAPQTPGTYHIVATSVADPTKTAIAAITVVQPVSVTISPRVAGTLVGGSQPFVATVTGASNTAVMWSVQEGSLGGAITSAGVFTAPQTPGQYHVTAASAADPTKVATATINVVTATGPFTPTGNMLAPRVGHTATLLQDGRVLVAGGDVLQPGDVSVAELYDPAAGSFSATGTMVWSRDDHSATLLQDGRVLIAGGSDTEQYIIRAELYDPATGTFTATGEMLVSAPCHAATLLPNGKVLIITGEEFHPGFPVALTAELYDPGSGKFTSTAQPVSTHPTFGADLICPATTLLLNGKVLVTWNSTLAELYDPDAGVFSPTGALNSTPYSGGYTQTLLADGKVLVAGGESDFGADNSAELYDPATGTFTATGSMTTPASTIRQHS